MNYIYNIKHIHDNYMFHNKELSVNDIVWGYDPKGKRIKGYCKPTLKEEDVMYFSCNNCIAWADGEPPYEGCTRNLKISYNPPYEGTGTITSKYKVVEVYEYKRDYDNKLYAQDTKGRTEYIGEKFHREVNKYDNQRYAYKLEKIEDVSMELSEFSVISKIDKGIYGECGNNLEGCNLCDHNGECPIQFNNMVNATLTRYNGLTQVILRSDERMSRAIKCYAIVWTDRHMITVDSVHKNKTEAQEKLDWLVGKDTKGIHGYEIKHTVMGTKLGQIYRKGIKE